MFTAYIDESGAHDQSPYIGVGGVIASGAKWAEFDREWRKALSDAGAPYSHMREFAPSVGAFRKWESATKQFEPERTAFLRSICDCIVRNVAYTFGAIITRRHYEALVPEQLRADMGVPYTFLGRYCIARVGVWAQDHSPDEPVDLVFERGQPQTALRIQHGILGANQRTRREYKLGRLSFADKYVRDRPEESALPLQAADLVAYELVKHWNTVQAYARRLVGPHIPPDLRRYALKRLMEIPRDWNMLTATDIAREVRTWQIIRDYAEAGSGSV
jgi:hypothetical protein